MRKIFWAGMAIFLLAGCAALGGLPEREQIYGKEPPVITDSFASKKMSPGDTWKVYIKASDPDGDMRQIICTVEQAGMGSYPVTRVKIREGQEREFSGFLYLATSPTPELYHLQPTLTVEVKDKAGHLSKPVKFPLELNPRATQENPPPGGTFQEAELGPIMVTLGSSASLGGAGSE